MQNRTVLISGASIAGPALAYWLHQYGFQPTIVERAPALREGGYKVDIRGTAVEVIRRMNLLDTVEQQHVDMRGAAYVNHSGKRVATTDADLFGGRTGEDVEIMRGDLAQILYDATRDNVEYRFNDSITAITQGEDGVTVSFERGETQRFDLVIGADGLHSNVRSLLFGNESQFVRDLGHYISIFSVPNTLNLDGEEAVYALPGKTVNLYATQRDAAAKALFMFASPPLSYNRRDSAEQKRILAQTFADEGWETPRLLEQMADAPDFYFDSISQIHMENWSSGRVALVGDAAYGPSPASGQGTSVALVGAYVLAGELAAAAGDYRAAFAAYEHTMRPYVEQNQQLAVDNLKGMVLPSRLAVWFQLLMIRLMPHLPGKERIIGQVTERIHQAATAITLKDYRAALAERPIERGGNGSGRSSHPILLVSRTLMT